MLHSFDPKLSWDSDSDNILNDFYKPALKNCKQYDRLAGYFSSTSFMIAVKETLDFIENGGIIRLITSAEFSKQDVEILEKVTVDVEQTLVNKILKEFEESDEITSKCTALLGWMLSKHIGGVPQLEIKIAIPKNRGIFHPKVGILTMQNSEVISFSGSVNETGNAWQGNIEEFKVFKSWGGNTNNDVINHDKRYFEKFYTDTAENVQVISLPDAIKAHMLKVRPKSTEEFMDLVKSIKQDIDKMTSRFQLRDYQKIAILEWEKNNFCGIFEMATGTGKTHTALGGISKLQTKTKRLAIVITTPYTHLTEQWIDNVLGWNTSVSTTEQISETIIRAFDNSNWKIELGNAVYNFNKKSFSGNYLLNDLIIYTTYATLATDDFINYIKRIEGDILLIADEAHWIGASKTSKGLLREYTYRLGLSATPERHYDEEGTFLLSIFFDKIVYKLDIEESINNGYLVPYYYYPLYVELTTRETEIYEDLTIKIAKKLAIQKRKLKVGNDDTNKNLEIKRANLVANAEQKYKKLEEILCDLNNDLQDTLIYCDPHQLDNVTKILTSRNITNDSITWKDAKSERRRIIKSLTNRHHDCITAIRCLDEGVDIPTASLAILMSSSRNPRQYIQRRGRILRQSPKTEKTFATIYDILVRTTLPHDGQFANYEKKLVAMELLRHKEFADIALNRKEAFKKIEDTAKKFDINLKLLSDEYVQTI